VRWSTVRLVLAKELRETLRDRRTLVMMVVIPIFLYPLLFVVIEQVALLGQRNLKARVANVAVVGAEANGLAAFLARDGALHVTPRTGVPARELQAGTVDAAVVAWGAPGDSSGTGRVRVLYDASRDASRHAREVVDARLAAWSDSLLARRLERQGLPATFAKPLAVADTSVASARKLGGYTLGRFLPMILILMTVLGAFYPAIDMAAGEKERGTLETLLTAPVPAREIVAGKFAAVSAIGFAAAALNLASMLLTFQSGLFQVTRAAGLDFRLPAGSIVLVLAMMVPLAVLFSALFLGLAVRAQSFKEAQNALTPVYIASIIPVFLATMPGIEFTALMAVVPVGGVAFLFRELLSGTAPLVPSALALLSTSAYAALALVLAARAFGREEVLFGTGSGEAAAEPWSARLRRWRTRGASASADEDRVPTVGEAAAFIAGVAVLFFYLAPQAAAAFGERGIPLSTVLLLGLPAVVFARTGPYDWRRTLGLRAPGWRTMAAAVLIALGGIPLGWALGWLELRFVNVPKELFGQLAKLTMAPDLPRMLWLLLIVAVLPGICEELVFRGVLLQSLSARWEGWRAIVVSAAVFGAFHLSFETVLRFLPTMWIGLLMGYVVWHSRSTFASMAMHALSNGLAVVVISAPPAVSRVLMGPGDSPNWLLVALGPFVIAAGVALLPKRGEGLFATPPLAAAG
jgi:sodium transport system permease protein